MLASLLYKPQANHVQTSSLWGRTMPSGATETEESFIFFARGKCKNFLCCLELKFDSGLYIWKNHRWKVCSWHDFLQLKTQQKVFVWGLRIWRHSTSKVSPRMCSFRNVKSCVQTVTRFFDFCTCGNTAEGRAAQTNKRVKNRWSRNTGSEVHANPLTCNFPVQECGSNYTKANPNNWYACRHISWSPQCQATSWRFQHTRTSSETLGTLGSTSAVFQLGIRKKIKAKHLIRDS